jgi:hypothetical protein
LFKAITAFPTFLGLVSHQDAFAEGSTKIWGAAELDAAMYMCGATGKLFNTPIFCPPKTKATVAAARELDYGLSNILSNLPGIILVEKFGISKSEYFTAKRIMSEKFEPEFQKRARFASGETANQFGFDFNAYVEWRIASQFLPNTDQRNRFTKAIGKETLTALRNAGVDFPVYDTRKQANACFLVALTARDNAMNLATPFCFVVKL